MNPGSRIALLPGFFLSHKNVVCNAMKQYNPLTHNDFFEACNSGQRHFLNLDFEYLGGFSNKGFSDNNKLIHSDAYILTKALSEKEYKETIALT